jgi:hypothetical protein
MVQMYCSSALTLQVPSDTHGRQGVRKLTHHVNAPFLLAGRRGSGGRWLGQDESYIVNVSEPAPLMIYLSVVVLVE